MKKSNNFEFFNPNPTAKKQRKNGTYPRWDKPDCVIRAFCAATDMTWIDAYDYLCQIGREIYDVPNSVNVLEIALPRLGFTKIKIETPKAGGRWKNVSELAEEYADYHYCFKISNHQVGGKNGYYHDVWDCGHKAVRLMWIKK